MRLNVLRSKAAPIFRKRRANRGFSLMEALVAVTIITVGIVSVMASLGAMAKSAAKLRTKEVMMRLAQRKWEDILVTSQTLGSDQDGDFTDWNETRYKWSSHVDTTGVDNLDAITLTVTPTATSSTDKVSITGLVYIPQATSTTTTP